MVFELDILAVLRFDTSDAACTGSMLGPNTTLNSACTSSISGSNTLDTACTCKFFGGQYSRYGLYFKYFVVRYSGILSVLEVFRDPVQCARTFEYSQYVAI